MTVKVLFASKAQPGQEQKVYKSLQKHKGVKELHLIDSGIYDVIALIEVASLESYREFITKIAELKGLSDFESFIRTDSD